LLSLKAILWKVILVIGSSSGKEAPISEISELSRLRKESLRRGAFVSLIEGMKLNYILS
jgi:hypothetical protein